MGRKPRLKDGASSSSSLVAVAAANADTNGDVAAPEELRQARRSIQIDQLKYYLENDCLLNYMNKTEAAAFLLIEQGGQPAVTEIVWEELERQNPEFFIQYKLRLIVKDQIVKFNELLASQSSLMENFNGVTSGSLPNGDLKCSTSPDASNSNNTHGSTFPLSENQRVHAVNSSTVPALAMDNSARVHHGMNGTFGQNGNVHAPMMDNSVRVHCHSMNGAFAQNVDIHAPALAMDNSARVHQGMNGAFGHNGNVHASMMDNSFGGHHHSMDGAFAQNGNIHAALAMDNSMRVHQGMNGAFVQDGNMCVSGMNMNGPIPMYHAMNRAFFPNDIVGVEGMDSSTQMMYEMNRAEIYSQATNSAVYNSFDARVPHLPPLIQNQPISYSSDETLQDLMERNRPPSEANNPPFPLASAMGLDDIFEGDFAEGMINDLPDYSFDA